jgi:hypothetical protein
MQWFYYILIGVFATIWLGLVFTALVVLPVIVAPVVLRRTLKLPLRPTLRPLDPAAGDVPRPVRRHFEKTAERLAPDGFRILGWFLLEDGAPGVKTVLAYLEDPASGEPAQLAALYGQPASGVWRLKEARLEFFADFADGVNVTTNNARALGAFGRAKGKTVLSFPGERDPRRLYRLHQALVRRLGSAAARRLRGERPAEEYLADGVVREVERQVGIGWFERDAAAGVYRPTWKGAVWMAWKMLPPAAAVRWLAARWRAAAFRRAAGAGVTA